jgi:ABC-type sugar transport system substrate-binding protein
VSSTRSRRGRAVSGLAVGTATLLVAACGSSSGGSTTSNAATGSPAAAPASAAAATSKLPKTLVFSPLSLKPPALKGLSEGVKGYGGSQGWQIIVQDPNFDPAKQTQALNEVISSGRAGAAWVIAVAPPTMAGVIKAAQSKGVPILVNGKPEEYGFTGPQAGITFDYIDQTAAGTALGEQTAACVTSKLGGNAKVLHLQSATGSAGKAEFDGSAQKALKAGAPNSSVVQTLIAVDRAKSQTDVGAALQGHPDINTVMAANDEAALGAMGAFAAAGKKLPCLIDFGGNPEVLKDVKAGSIFSSVALQFQDDMKQSFDTLVKMQGDPKAVGQVLTVPQKVITAAG